MIVVTDRSLCKRPFLAQLESILSGHPEMVILREKSLSRNELVPLAYDCLMLCEQLVYFFLKTHDSYVFL
jgi:thiamine monophosphate synthase